MQTKELWLVQKYYLQTMRLQIICMYKENLALNNLQGLIGHKTQIILTSLSLFIHCYYILYLKRKKTNKQINNNKNKQTKNKQNFSHYYYT